MKNIRKRIIMHVVRKIKCAYGVPVASHGVKSARNLAELIGFTFA